MPTGQSDVGNSKQLIFSRDDSRPCQLDSFKLLKTALRHLQASFDILRTLTPCTRILKGPKREMERGLRKALNSPNCL